MDFTNTEIEEKQLPQFDKINFKPLDKKLLNVMRINMIILPVVAISAFCIFNYITEEFTLNVQLYIIGAIVCLTIVNYFYASVSYKYRGYALREKDISYKKGYIWRSAITIPFNRIQHTEIKEGAISRFFSLQTVKFYTAGGSTSDLQIAGLNKKDAQKVKEYVNGKIDNYEE